MPSMAIGPSALDQRIQQTKADGRDDKQVHFNHDRHLNPRDIFKQNRAAALAEWRQLAA